MPTVAFAPYAVPQFLDNEGKPIRGGTLETYLAGTSTPAATYADSAGSAPNPTTIQLDSAGRPANGGALVDLRLDVSKTYKFVVKDASGAVIRTVDNIAGGVSAASVVESALADGAVSDRAISNCADKQQAIARKIGAVHRISTVAELETSEKPDGPTVVEVLGYTTPGDGGGGVFYWDPASEIDPDGVCTFAASEGGSGRWLRSRAPYDSGAVSLRWAGGTGRFADDQTEAFKRLRDYLDSQRFGPSSGALQNSVGGIKVFAPRGIYTLKEQVIFGPYLSVEFNFNHAEIYYNGPDLGDEGALVFHNLSWVSLRNIYSYAPLEVRSCYRVDLQALKIQGLWVVNDCWNTKATSCWNYYGRTIIKGGNQQCFDNCAWEFGGSPIKVMVTNPSSLVFKNCYTEWLDEWLRVSVSSSSAIFRSLIIDSCFLDVQKKGSVYDNGTAYIRLINVLAPTAAKVVICNTLFHSIALPPSYNASGAYVRADPFFTDVVIKECSFTASAKEVELGTYLDANGVSLARIFSGPGIRVVGWAPANDNAPAIPNGRFTYPAVSKANADGCDIYREGNIGWVFDGTAVTNGAGALTVSTGTIVTRDIPVAVSGRRLTHKAIRPGYYWLVVAHKNGSFQIEAVRFKGAGAGKFSAPVNGSASAIVSGYPTSGVTNTAHVTFTKVLLYIPAQDDTSADITWLRIRFTANHASANTTFYGVGLYPAGSIPETQFQDAREEMALSNAPTFNGNWVGQTIPNRAWTGTGTRAWVWTASNTWAAVA